MSTFRKNILFLAALASFSACVFFNSGDSFAQNARRPDTIQTSPFDLNLTTVGTVEKIVKSDTVRLSNGKIFKIDNIRVPIQLDAAAIKYLEDTLLNQKIGLYILGEDPVARADRFGHTLAHVVTENGNWIQAEMVSRGLAWVSGGPNSRDLVLPLYKYEDLARTQGLGMWSRPEFAIRDNDTIDDGTYNSFQVYQGKLKAIRTKGDYIFFNFGDNPQTDFSISFNKKELKPFRLRSGNHSHTPTEFVGHTIRIRGWIEENGGPMMVLEYPEQLEFPELSVYPIVN
jgi:endonuclease YncB( thermonuclease family)